MSSWFHLVRLLCFGFLDFHVINSWLCIHIKLKSLYHSSLFGLVLLSVGQIEHTKWVTTEHRTETLTRKTAVLLENVWGVCSCCLFSFGFFSSLSLSMSRLVKQCFAFGTSVLLHFQVFYIYVAVLSSFMLLTLLPSYSISLCSFLLLFSMCVCVTRERAHSPTRLWSGFLIC